MQLTKNIFVNSELSACNLSMIITREGIVMIDTPGNAHNSIKWRDEINGRGILRYVINTEEHGDHCTGSWFFPGVLITSEKTREKVAGMSSKEIRERAIKNDPSVSSLMQTFEMRLADITFEGRMGLHLGDQVFIMFALPGHTPGGIGVHVPEERVVFCCDCVFHKVKTWLQDANPEQWLESINKLGKLDVDTIVPGHGSICTRDYLHEQATVIKDWVLTVKEAIKKGWSQDEAVSRIVPPDPYPKQATVSTPEDEINRRSIIHLYQLYSGSNQAG
ncbi:MBL fold metallo-hydrolase [Chloroflexota bacterium]